MRHEKLFEPVSGAEPCGPDLDEVGDEDYLNYILPAEERLPSSFFDKTGAPIDRSGLDLKAEVTAIGDLLERSRDLRLLALEARFQMSAGQIVGFSESIQAIAGLVSRFWTDVHPIGFDGDFTLRQNTVAALDDRARVILPLQFTPLFRDKKLGQISYRAYALATGETQPRPGETKLEAGDVVEALGREENQAAVTTIHAALKAAGESLDAIRNSFIESAGYEYTPSFDGLSAAIAQIIDMIAKGNPALAGAPAPAPAREAGTDITLAPTPGDARPGPAGVLELPPALVATQQEGAAALLAVDQYFSINEPSVPALLLVRQARLLIGKPLVAALEALVPESVEKAIIKLESTAKFQIDMNRMRLLSGEPLPDNRQTAPSAKTFSAATRAEASALIAGVEHYFRSAEPSSPVPMLLNRARGYLNQDFLAILKDLIESE